MKNMWKKVVVLAMTLGVFAVALPFSAAARSGEQGANLVLSRNLQQMGAADKAPAADNGIAKANVESFSTGFAMVRVMYYAGTDKAEDGDASAILELVYLIDKFEGQPAEAAQLQKVLKMVVRNTGTRQERWNAVQDAINTHRKSLHGEALWYFNLGVIVPKLSLYAYLKDSAGLKSDFSSFQQLVQNAPQGVPAAVLTPMQQLAKYATQASYSNDELAAIGSTTGTVMDAVSS